MGGGNSKSSGSSEENLEQGGGQLYVSLKMDCKLSSDLVPHVYGSVPLVGSWDSSKSLAMERESASMWEISFVVPRNHETLDFKFLLQPKHAVLPCIVEEGPNRLLTGGALQGNAGSALFRLPESDEVLEYHVYIKADRVSPFDLAASWRAYRENLQPSTVRGIPDVSINAIPVTGLENSAAVSLELDLEHYEVPLPASSVSSGPLYVANTAETPRSMRHGSIFSNSGGLKAQSLNHADCSINTKDLEAHTNLIMVESKSVATYVNSQKQDPPRGFYVDRDKGKSATLVWSGSSANFFGGEMKLDTQVGSLLENHVKYSFMLS